jgi:hypothetical protein
VPSPADHVTEVPDAAADDHAAHEALCRRLCQVADQVVCGGPMDCVGGCVFGLEDPNCHPEAVALYTCYAQLQASDYACEGSHRVRRTSTCEAEGRTWAGCINGVQTGLNRDGGRE